MLKIFISTFNKPAIKIKHGIPIEVGAINRENFIYNLHDDTGDNISIENSFFGELTGLYWIWKNMRFDNSDYIGFCHYNKALHLKRKHYKLINDSADIWITTTPFKNRNHPIQNELDAICLILKNDYPDCYITWKEFYNEDGSGKSDVCMGANIFLTSYEEFDNYCCFLFDILFKLRKAVGEGSADLNMKRYCAFMAERLLSVYLKTYGKNVVVTDIKNSQWYLSHAKKIAEYLKISKESSLYQFFKKYFGYKSSYGRK